MRRGGPFRMPDRALVVGMGVSGRSVCELLLRNGVEVVATDLRPLDRFGGTLDELRAKGCRLRLGAHHPEDFLNVDQIIVSPGVPSLLEPLREARLRGIEIAGEFEWAWRQVDAPVIAVTGTNGKTTTTALIGEMIKASGRRVFVGGNIGTPLSRWLLDGDRVDCMVLEVSSFQLDTAFLFRPEVGVLLNVTEDHLDRYRDFEEYTESKFSMFGRQESTDVAVINLDDPVCGSKPFNGKGRLLTSSRKDPRAHAHVEDGRIIVNVPWKPAFRLDLADMRLKGAHNEENVLAAILACLAMDVAPEAVARAAGIFGGLPHRVEWIRAVRGVDYYDDSKGTNVGAVVKAIENFDRPVLLLLGGRDKLGSYAPIAERMRTRGKGVFVFGESAPRIHAELRDKVPSRLFSDLEGAFAAAVERAEAGDIVLLSPACSSFDQYESYAQRGDHFKKLVAALPG
ncbi:MAG TPA: UDP-N-acetylmuramoyl-L-alanine--D-glutamate ligase [Syntrophobacter fumaroxidans]|nr:UDP-N-acetylmuramoyl-L-alanine--D-glutamate ligase [Syntrophobacter fumaroxidans]